MNASSAMLGRVWSSPTPRITASAMRRRRSSASPSGSATAMPAASEASDQQQVAAGQRHDRGALDPEIVQQAFPGPIRRLPARPACRLRQPEPSQRVRGDRGDRLPVHLDPPVEPPHVGLVEQPAQLGERAHRRRHAVRQTPAGQRRGLVGRKEVLVVLQHHEIVARDEPVGRVAVDHVHLSGRERLVLHRRQERAHRAEAEPVGLRQPGQPVGPADEVGREAGAQRGRDPRQIAERGESRLSGGLPPHRDGVGVLEAERREPARRRSARGTRATPGAKTSRGSGAGGSPRIASSPVPVYSG